MLTNWGLLNNKERQILKQASITNYNSDDILEWCLKYLPRYDGRYLAAIEVIESKLIKRV
jgi:hypothetical protein